MSKCDSTLNVLPYQSSECIIGHYIESLAHEVISNKDIRFERANQDLLFFAKKIDIPNFGSTFCRMSIASLLVDICGRNPEALSSLKSSEWFETLKRIRSSFEACERNDASKFITPKLKTSNNIGVFPCDELDEAKNSILASNTTIDAAYRDVISRVTFHYSLSFIRADLNRMFSDSHREVSHIHVWNEDSLSKFIDSIHFNQETVHGQFSESTQVLTELLGTIQRNLHMSTMQVKTSIHAIIGTKEFKKYSDFSLLQHAVEDLFTSLYFLVFGPPVIQQIGGSNLTSHQAEHSSKRIQQALNSQHSAHNHALFADHFNSVTTDDGSAIGEIGDHIHYSEFNAKSILQHPITVMDMDAALHNLNDHRERLRNDVNDPLQSQLIYASQALMVPRPFQGESNLDILANNYLYPNSNGCQQHLYTYQTHYPQHLYHTNTYNLTGGKEMPEFDPNGFYGRIRVPTKIAQDESQDSLMADSPPRELKSPGTTSKKRRRRLWSEEEKAGLISGYLKHGRKWAIIKKEFPSLLGGRTGQDLKDCFRNMINKGEIMLDEKGKLKVTITSSDKKS